MLRAASVVAGLVLVSKGFGFAREVVVAGVHGAGVARDAYNLAYQLPAYVLVMLGGLNGPFHSAAVAALTRGRTRGSGEGDSLVVSLLVWVGLFMAGVAVAVAWAAPVMLKLQGPWVSEEVLHLAVPMLRWMAPILALGAWIGLLSGLSQDRGDVVLPSLSPLLSSLAVVVAVLLRPGDPMALAWGTALGAGLQASLQGWPAWRSLAGSGRLTLVGLGDPRMREVLGLLWPAILSSSVGQLNVLVGTFFLSRAGTGALSAWGYANVLYQLPLGTLLAALLVPLFPKLTETAARGDLEAMRQWLFRGASLVSAVCLPLVAGLVVLAGPLVSAAFVRGQFTVEDAGRTSMVLACLAAGLVAYAMRDLMVRCFYALNDSRTPLKITLVSLLINIFINSVLTFGFGAGLAGIAAATVAVTWANALQVGFALHRRIGGLGLGELVTPFRRGLANALLAGGAAWCLNSWLASRAWWPQGFWGHVALLLLGGGLGLFLVAAGLIGSRIRRGAMMAPVFPGGGDARGPGEAS
ncbi:MAG: murein biosynthesis integral membrane protein MurJ [Candidatus Sericytochromatia bacterium]|nr:murein biosynthesis integral membrane protein MurJ [Candidatus Sericytochromatia bacterium]